MESGSFSAILCLAKNTGSILFQNANKARHPPFRFIYHSVSSQSTPNSLWRTSFSGFPWISPASFLKMSVAFFFLCLLPVCTQFPSQEKRKEISPFSLILRLFSHISPACLRPEKGFLLLHLLSPKMSFYFPCLTRGCSTAQPHWDFHITPRTTSRI